MTNHTTLAHGYNPLAVNDPVDLQIRDAVQRYWGFSSLRPLQEQAIRACLNQRDSLVVLPTGGGKSLCYQVPPLISGETCVVVSPLISLMKDQVDGLREIGYPAAALHSGMTAAERYHTEAELVAGRYKLLFVSPERLLMSGCVDLLRRIRVRSFAIDEAHCISHWGHDFRPEYRQLAQLREMFRHRDHTQAITIHAFTATATPRVREDIARQLNMEEPEVLVGTFDRPNLIYRVLPRVDTYKQATQVLSRHRGEAAIVYCISRKDTETMAAWLCEQGFRAAHYHAGMTPLDRRTTQEKFSNEELEVVVATVAFGMGIDRSNVRCVLHAGMPKSIEHYQQESGRAGRDGLEAECVLLYSSADAMKWEFLLEKQASESEVEVSPESIASAKELIKQIQKFCSSPICRHRGLTEYFGQTYKLENCAACDVCLSEVEGIADATVLAQKILSCVARVGQNFGIGHVVDVLTGSQSERILQLGHHQLSTYALLKDMPKKALSSLVYQLIDQDVLTRTPGDLPVLKLNAASWEVMRGQRAVRLHQAKKPDRQQSAAQADSMEGVDQGLMESLRAWRKSYAMQKAVPPYVVFDDRTLRALARVRPTTLENLQGIVGFGSRRTANLGEPIVLLIGDYCREHELPTNQQLALDDVEGPQPRRISPQRSIAAKRFAQGCSIDQVAREIDRARSTTTQYLAEYILEYKPRSIDTWVSPQIYAQVAAVAHASEDGRLAPLHEKLGQSVSYEDIRLVLAHLQAMSQTTESSSETSA